mmetsp:Transcript_20239/g.31906  ORF Transcript_20239/g.31906 Transcript_20239/m.31906 type:complete len:370 (+) Transcript_20239:90-1199(+)
MITTKQRVSALVAVILVALFADECLGFTNSVLSAAASRQRCAMSQIWGRICTSEEETVAAETQQLSIMNSLARKAFLDVTLVSSLAILGGKASAADEIQAEAALLSGENKNSNSQSAVETGPQTLKFRLATKEVGPPARVIQGQDVFYPEWCAGLWDSYSTTRDVEAPCGIKLFGGDRSWAIAQKDIGEELQYLTRFRYLADGRVIADRAYNIESITGAAMGANSVLEVPFQDDPNDISFTLSPVGAQGNVFKANLRTLGRCTESGVDSVTGAPTFSVSEVVRQTVSSTTDLRFNPLVKDIETITVYSRFSADEIRALQRTATYFVPIDPVQQAKYAESKGKAIDVRCYKVLYKLKKKLRNTSFAAAAV